MYEPRLMEPFNKYQNTALMQEVQFVELHDICLK